MSDSDRGDDPPGGSPRPLVLEVAGRPTPQGSMRAFAIQNKQTGKFRGVVAQGGSKARRDALAEWRAAVRDSVFAALGVRELEAARFVEVPLEVVITFRLSRPASHFGTGKNAGKLKASAPTFPTGAPDVDKLARAVLDALKGTAFDDDSRVVDLHPRKVYADAGELEGATIRIAIATLSPLAPVLAIVPSSVRPMGGPNTLGESLGLATCRLEKPPATQLELGTAAPVAAVDPEERKQRSRERIRRVINGTPIAGELAAYGRKSHALERHAPAATASELRLLEASEPAAELAVRCNGDHPMPECPDPHCWRRDPIDIAIRENDRAELARRLLEAPAGSLDERRCIAALAGKIPDADKSPSDVDFGIEDFGGPDV